MKDSEYAPIPEEFYSFETQKPFTHCLVCKANLLSGEVDYFIEKAIRNYHEHEVKDVVYEYAICLSCAQDMNAQMSNESLENLQRYFAQHPSLMTKMADYSEHWQEKEEDLIPDKCVVSGQPVNTLDEYMIYAHFRGDKLVKSSMPYLLSGEIMDEVADLLSNQTIDQLDDFMGEYFGGPPELEELWKPRRPVFF